ncbi:dimethyl sulfoxide reductase anchor subunit [Mesorhizobium sp. YIM 152430]|uniref:dimethyl sulfoxide reductase anchor subunit family protein n=1 Tax=Mesorhizobium sp. YIM 152430 TaxID=3031761 RepID=UPI0023DBF107|nr:DmsC/YnfH family molybdoenzyme membrane anchor subunit [Mesorhizobium sp. YIM 152430]MDF1599769.1 dimethyl sulfoxide reductase anchor subunit [Mesorhizobium sp. YIM 152430]
MHPALSIIVFTTLSGMGYGLAALLGLGLFDPAALATKIGYVLALALIAGGLVSSTLHLGNPQRAWRALSQWRTSWLSREGVLAILAFIPLTICAYAAIFHDRHLILPGLAAAGLGLVTVYCTAMIYGSLKTVQLWSQRLTPVTYLLFALASGATLGTLLAVSGAAQPWLIAFLAVSFTVAAWLAKRRWRNDGKALAPLSTPETATGLGSIGRVRLFERPHINDNYLTREMGFQVARKHADKLFGIAILLGGLIPAALVVVAALAAGAMGPGLTAFLAAFLAVLSHYAGVFVERWLFFAEARHAVMNYYGR